jgi:hypothetical protein
METVKLDISIEISTQDVVDTGLTVEQWNALSATERYAMAKDAWDAMAESDDGGMSVATAGAEDI